MYTYTYICIDHKILTIPVIELSISKLKCMHILSQEATLLFSSLPPLSILRGKQEHRMQAPTLSLQQLLENSKSKRSITMSKKKLRIATPTGLGYL